MNSLTINEAKNLIGKKIKWQAPGYNTLYTGIDIITAVDASKEKPLTTQSITGDDLYFAFNEHFRLGKCNEQHPLAYSDGDRYVTFITID